MKFILRMGEASRELDWDSMPLPDAIACQKLTGLNYHEWRQALLDDQAEAVAFGWWLAGQRAIAEPLLASVDDPTAPLAAGICREYHFADTRRGDCLWLFHDPGPRRWFLHGAIG